MEWRRYVPVAARRAKALREMNKLRKKGKDIQPIEIEGRTIARSFWGKRWCEHLESFSDYANRLPRGRTYVRNGSVCHLAIQPGRIDAIVSGSELYDVTIRIDKLKAVVWKSVKTRCSGQIGSMLELLQGKLSQQVMGVVTDRDRGLFPKPGEIKLDCSCPDWATMCKHVASVLYGVGSRLDDRPESLFLLRGVDTAELIATEMALPGDSASDDALADDALAGIFGIDLDTDIDTDIKLRGCAAARPESAGKAAEAGAPARRHCSRTAGAARREGPGPPCLHGVRGASSSQGIREYRPRQDTFSDPHASETCRREGSECPRHQGRHLTPRHPAYRKMGGPAAPAERSLRRPIRRRARRIGSDCVSLGSDPRAAQPARPPAERPPCLVPAVR